jgi:hypothetical protein
MQENPVCWYPGQWLGNAEDARNVEWLREKGIRRIITCAKEIGREDLSLLGDIEWIHYPMEDHRDREEWGRIQNVMWFYLEDAVGKLEDSLRKNIPTLIHCVQGWQRSPAVLCCLWTKRFGWEPLETVEMMRNFRGGSFQRECHFESLILEWGRQHFFNLNKK